MVPELQLTPDTDAIRRDLEFMTARWDMLAETAVIEIRAFKEHSQPHRQTFSLARLLECVEWIASMNALGFNIYAVRNPVRATCSRDATDNDILASFFLWADCDDDGAADNVRRWEGPKYSAAVITGRTPAIRVHTYWSLSEPCYDLSDWRSTQAAIAAHFGSDPAVINPSRIMRVGGTVSHPDSRKRGKGYVSELTTIRTEYEDTRAPVSLDQMRRAFGTTQPATSSFTIETGGIALDRERTRIQALSGEEWHNAVIRLVASYVAKGLADGEIHQLTDPLTLPGYTVDQTRREVQTAIDGARRKGWAPEAQPYAVPAFDVPTTFAADPKKPAPVEWLEDISAALADNYIVKGVIADGGMSVVYGPSNSGKTFFVLDLAWHIATGKPWRGYRTRQAAVLYLAAEGGRGVQNRIAALKKERGTGPAPFALRRAGLDLLHDQADLTSVFQLSQEVKEAAIGLPLFIVIDTLSRVMAGGDENSAQDMTALIRNIDAIREATGAHILLVHHTGKDAARGARGHSSLKAAVDTEMEVECEGNARAAKVTKQRDYQGGQIFAFDLKPVALGFDQDGDEVTSCVVEAVEADDFKVAQAAGKPLGGNQKIIADTFAQMVSDGLAKPNPGGVGMPEPGKFWCVEMEELRRHAQGKMAASNKRGAFLEAWRALSEGRGLFCMASELVWRTDRRISN